jgi:hypothetical protein
MKTIDGQIRKIEPLSGGQEFFDFEFWGESDEDNYGLLCLLQISKPKKLFIIEMNTNEISASDDKQDFKAVIDRISRETGVTDLIFPKILRFEDKKSDVKKGFQNFLNTYQKSTPIYKSIFDSSEEATQIKKLSIKEFYENGGEIVLFGDLNIQHGRS